MSETKREAVIIGSGFGGAINACRLSMRWPGEVLVLERGKKYPLASFPRSPNGLSRNLWNIPEEPRPWSFMRMIKQPFEGRASFPELRGQELHGMFDIRSYSHMDVIQSAGLGRRVADLRQRLPDASEGDLSRPALARYLPPRSA